MIARFLKFTLRKDITKKNKSINHVAFLKSMTLKNKTIYQAKYHKKKLIASIILAAVIYTYDLQKSIYRYVLSIRSPMHFISSMFSEEAAIEKTILQQNYGGLDLKKETIDFLISLYTQADKYLFFGVGRSLLFEIYKDLGCLVNEQEMKRFWLASGFYKQRNQKASGVGLVQYLKIFQEAFKYLRKKQKKLTEEVFLQRFSLTFIQKIPYILEWEKSFNKERVNEFLKNMPADNEKRKEAITEIIRDISKTNPKLITEGELEEKIKSMGMKGLNLTDKMMYWQLRRTWQVIRIWCLDKKIAHPLATWSQKAILNKQKEVIAQQIEKCQQQINKIQITYKELYRQDMF